MTAINTSQVQATNDASVVSKVSMIQKGYVNDNFQHLFVDKLHQRAPLIHFGYYTRFVIIDGVVRRFIHMLGTNAKFQIISCGCGFDSLYWRLSESGLLSHGVVFEIDFEKVIRRKLQLIQQNNELLIYCFPPSEWKTFSRSTQCAPNYFLGSCDLSHQNELNEFIQAVSLDVRLPTLVLSECAVTYMHCNESDQLFQWISSKFDHVAVATYEQINPDDGFGGVMMRHFERLKSPLRSVNSFPTCLQHAERYKRLGFSNAQGIDEWTILKAFVSEQELNDAFQRESFDEFEELHAKCSHYVLAIATKGIADDFCLCVDSTRGKQEILPLEYRVMESEIGLYCHSSCQISSQTVLFGGIGLHGKQKNAIKCSATGKSLSVMGDVTLNGKLDFNMIHGTTLPFVLCGNEYILCYGGRTSPGKIWTDGSLVIVNTTDWSFSTISKISSPIPRYRTSLILFTSGENDVIFYMFGGRCGNLKDRLNDFWKLQISMNNGSIDAYWSEISNDCKPSCRMSHSMVTHEGIIYVIGGLDTKSWSALDDLWTWNPELNLWTQMSLEGRITPRYGHSCHTFENKIILVGGSTTISDYLPAVSVIWLDTLLVREYSIQMPGPEPYLLFNHTSELSGDGKDIIVMGGGGNCFSFGTHINSHSLVLPLCQFE